jgi:hypothetical protein
MSFLLCYGEIPCDTQIIEYYQIQFIIWLSNQLVVFGEVRIRLLYTAWSFYSRNVASRMT